MKKLFLTLSFSVIILALRLTGQTVSCRAHFDNTTCTDTIPSEATIVTGTIATTTESSCFWICTLSNLTLFSGSSNVNIDMENLAQLNASGSEITIWAKKPNTINLDSCITVKVHIEEGVVVNVDATCSFVEIDTCESIIFNYSLAPEEGCFPTSVMYIPKQVNKLYPVPAHQYLMIQIPDLFNQMSNVTITDISGRLMRSINLQFDTNGNTEIDLSGLSPGIYLINSDRIYPEMLVIQ